MTTQQYNQITKYSWLGLAITVLITSFTGVDYTGKDLVFWASGFVLILLKLTPLLLVVKGIWGQNSRSHIWACYVSMFYFIWAVLMFQSDEPLVLSIAASVCTVGLFIGGMMFYRRFTRQQD